MLWMIIKGLLFGIGLQVYGLTKGPYELWTHVQVF